METASLAAGRIVRLAMFFLVYTAHNHADATVKVSYISPRDGSLHGGTLINIYGREFAEDQFNYFDESLGHRVELYNSWTSMECDIVPYLSNPGKITCETRPVTSEGDYYVRVHKNGQEITALGGSYCNAQWNCRFRYRWGHTPVVVRVTPSSGTPGTLVSVYARLFASQYGAVQGEEDQARKIERVKWGSYMSDLVDPETNELYGITLNSEGSQLGNMKTKPQGMFVASQLFGFKVNNNIGWSAPDLESLRVSGKCKLYHYQTHADITGIAPSSGSLEGGTLLTISGNYFYDRADTKVFVGGVPCDVQTVTDTQITCITKKAVENSAVMFPGGRGVYFDKWDESFSLDGEEWSTTEPSLTEEMYEGASPQHIDDRYVGRLRGYFQPPRTGNYSMLIRSDDESELYFSETGDNTNMTVIASGQSYTGLNWFRFPGQISEKMTLEGGRAYYFEARYREWGGGDWVQVGAMMFDCPFVSSDTDSALNEIQRIEVTSDIQKETQCMTIEGANEIQQVRLAYSGCVNATYNETVDCTDGDDCSDEEIVEEIYCEVNGTFKLSHGGQETGFIAITASAEEIEGALVVLPSLADIVVDVAVEENDYVWIYKVTFFTNEDIDELSVSVSDADTMEAGVTQLSPGSVLDEDQTFIFTYDGKDTKSLDLGASALEVQEALLDIFSVKCQALQQSAFFYNDFETDPLGDISGQQVTDVEPFCGRASLKNPSEVYLDGIKDASNKNPGPFAFSKANKLCMAVKGVISKNVQFRVQYTNDEGDSEEDTDWVATFDTQGDYMMASEWTFVCIDLEDTLSWHSYVDDRSFRIVRIRFQGHEINGKVPNYYIDNFYLGKSSIDPSSFNRQRAANPNGILVADVNVTKSNNSYCVTMTPANCGHDFPLLGIRDTQVLSGSAMADSDMVEYIKENNVGEATVYSVRRSVTASPPVEGSFQMKWNDKMVTVPADASAEKVKELVERLGTGTVVVQKQALQMEDDEEESVNEEMCHGYTLDVEFTSTGGSQPFIEVNDSSITGNNASVDVVRVQEGAVIAGPIPGEFLRLVFDEPQVEVVMDGIPSSCSGNCSFIQSEADTPTVTAVTPTDGKSGTQITISGSGFVSDNTNVTIGDSSCAVTSTTSASVICTAGEGLVGTHKVMVSVTDKGLASHPSAGDVEFEHTWAVTGVSPASGSTAGGSTITLTGHGFTSLNISVTVGGNPCVIQSITYSQIVCTISKIENSVSRRRKRATTTAGVTVTSGSTTTSAKNSFTFANSLTPTITDISPSSSSVLGGGTLTLTGTGFAATGNKVMLGDVECEIVTESETEITCTIPPHAPDQCDIELTVPAKGFADTSQINKFNYKLKVTGLSPDFGSILGGTMVTITGEGFGKDMSQISATFGDSECEIASLEDTQIVCETKPSAVEHEVSNQGKHEDYGTGYRWDRIELDISVGDTVRWWWAVPDAVTGVVFGIQQTANEDSTVYDGHGFYSGTRTPQGSFSYKFTAPGTYYYSSGPVDTSGELFMKGIIKAMEDSFAKKLDVMVGDFSAEHDMSQSVTITPSGDCTPVTSHISPCAISQPTPENADMFNFQFYQCSTPVIESITPNSGMPTTPLEIRGSGFGNNICQNDVMIGDHKCKPSKVSSTLITCDIQTEDTMTVGYRQLVSVKVNNRGFAINRGTDSDKHTFTLNPSVGSISPTQGSTEGGTRITITGDGFSILSHQNPVLTIGGSVCVTESATYTEIVCVTSRAGAAGTYPLSLYINNAKAECPNVCEFTYSADMTPNADTVTPTIVSGASTEITISGTGFTSTTSDVTVTIGGVECVVISASATEIVCSVGYVPVGCAELIVNIFPVGESSFSEGIDSMCIWSSKDIFDVSPDTGSKKGGQEISITGNGFLVDDTTVTIGGRECEITSIDISLIKCITPTRTGGEFTLQVISTTATQESHSYTPTTYTYSTDATPKADSVTPTSGKSGDSITIDGSRFSTTMSDNTVTIDEAECTVSSVTDSSIVCTLGDHSAGVYPIVVHVKGMGYAGTSLEFDYELGITSTSPSTGSFGGGRTLTVVGVGFGDEDNTAVSVCGNPCPILSITPTTIECDVPGNADTGATLDCDVVVKLDSGAEQSVLNALQYRRDMTPTITSVSPKRGGTGGGTTLTIQGTDFSATGNVVSIDGTTCAVITETTTEITCRTGQRSTTVRAKVRVKVGDKGIATQGNADYHYVDVWSSKYSWGGQDPPIQGDFVVIKAGQTILLDVDTPVLKMLLIQGGCLIFDDEQPDITLNSEHILIVDAGCLQIGTEEEPYMNKATIKLHGHVRSKELPMYGAKTLAVRNGTLDLHGTPIPITWTYLAATISAGDTELTLMQSVTWNVGDQIAIASTGHRHSQRENEDVTITAISGDGLTLTFDPAVEYDHISMVQTIDDVVLETRAEVGLLTRNVLVRGSYHKEWYEEIEACDAEFNTNQFATQTCFQGRFGDEIGSDEFGSQIMLFAKKMDKHSSIGRIEYVEVTHAGQAFRLGRYPIHFHLNGNVTGNYVRGCAIHHTFNRAVTIHAVHNLLVEHNVAYDIMGHAYFLEDGIETKNIIQYNLAVFVRPSSSLLNVDVTPAAFWVTNPDNIVRHNAAAGGSHFGYWYNAPVHPGGPSFTNQICPRNIPVLEFRNNTAHSIGWYGLWIFPVYYPRQEPCTDGESSPAEFYDLTAWEIERGAEGVEVGNVRFIDFVISDADQAGVEMQTTNDAWGGPMLKDSAIIGWSALSANNKSGECTVAGLKLPKSKFFTVDGVKFINFDQDRCVAYRGCSHCKELQGGFQSRYQNIKYFNAPNKAAFQWEHETWLEDLDGSLTTKGAGFENYKVLPKNGNLPDDHCTFNNSEFHVEGVTSAICDDTIEFHRMAFNEPSPDSLLYKDALFTNDHGTTRILYKKKRITHPFGWMLTLIGGDTYNFFFENVDHVTNISYNARLDDFADGDFVLLNHNLTQSPDKFATIGQDADSTVSMVTYADNVHGDYYFDDVEKELTYIVSGKGFDEPRDFNINLDVFQCYYTDCIPPPPDIPDAPPASRPDEFNLWSDTQSWTDQEEGFGSGDGVLPINGADVMILPGVWMVADVDDLPSMGKLFIYGTLELDPTRDFVLEAEQILIQGGQLVVGFEDAPYTNNGKIVLKGTHASEEMVLPGGHTVLGAKALGVFGGLDLHGVKRSVYWTHLENTVNSGDKSITVEEDTDWTVGDEIVLTTTDYDPWHTETFAISAVSSPRTFTLNATIQYKHLGESYTVTPGNINTYSIRAEVGLLTRNIKIEGADYNNLFDESFGARVLVGSFFQEGEEYRGYARISDVEFYHTGQEGHVDDYDPRYSLAFLDSGEVDDVLYPSYVTGCGFHSGFSPAIGFFGAHGVLVENNVIHHTVGPSVVDSGDNNKFIHNLVALVVFPGTYQDRNEPENLHWFGGFDVYNARDPILIDNTVAGSERAGYKILGEVCREDGAPVPATAWSGNVAHGALHGIHIFPDSQKTCSLISNFVLYRNYDFGIYIQARSSVIMSNVVLVDNHAGVLPLIVGPAATSHQTSEKFVRMENSLIVGVSPDFECGVDDNIKPDVAKHAKSHSGQVKSPDGGHIGFVWSTFPSGGNGAPFKKFHGLMNYPAISGLTEITNVVFSRFDDNCKRSYMIMTNKANGDFMHPIHTQGIMKDSVDPESVVFIHRPNLGDVNPSDCVDMDCDAMKKTLIRDLDGSLLGSVGTVIPESQFEWDGDARRGLGDYRIPKVMLTRLDGSVIPVEDKCPKKGIFGVEEDYCEWKTDWQAYECHGPDHMILILESLDADTEVRRLSPVALYTDKYVDLVNGPQDHGWCHGYTCQERISTFYTMVATGKEYEVYFTSTNPQRMRLHLLNAEDTQKVVVGIYYANPQRLDIYVRGIYVMPTNGKVKENGDFTWENEPGKDYKPTIASNVYGDNYFDRDWSTLYILVRGSAPVDIVTTPVIVVSFGVPAISVDEFFEENLIQNLVSFLGVEASQIRIVDIIAEDSVTRRRRSIRSLPRFKRAAEDTVEVLFEVGEQPADSIESPETVDPAEGVTEAPPVDEPTTAPVEGGLDTEALEGVGQILADTMQQGGMEEAIKVPVVSMAITDPEPPPVDPTGGVRATEETGGPANGTQTFAEMQAEEEAAAQEEHVTVVYQVPSQLMIHSESSGASEREAWSMQPSIKVLDAANVMVEQLGHPSNPWKLTATLRPGTGPEGANLIGNTTVPFSKGFASFTDLAIDMAGSGYMLDYAITYPNTTSLPVISSTQAITISKREYYAAVNSAPSEAYVDEDFDVMVDIKDMITDGFPQGIAEKSYTWKASASLYMPSNYQGSLNGTMKVTFDLDSAQAHFNDLSLDESGFQYILQVHVYTEPSSDYDFTTNTQGFDVKVRGQLEPTGEKKNVVLRFAGNYDEVVAGQEESFKINAKNKLSPMYTDVAISNMETSPGSILLAFDMEGDVEGTQAQMLEDLGNGAITLTFNGNTLQADYYLLVDGTSQTSSASVFPIWAVIIIVIVAIVMIVIIVLVVYCLFFRKKDKVISDTETIPLDGQEDKAGLPLQSMGSLNSSQSSDRQGVDTPISGVTEDEAISVRDLDEIGVDSPSLLRKSLNTPRRTPEVFVTSLPPGFTEGQKEKLLEDRRPMNLMARNDDDGTFQKLALLNVNLVGSVSELRQDINTALSSSSIWKDKKYILMKETLKDIEGHQEKKMTVSEVYSADCVLIRWVDEKDLPQLCVCGLKGSFQCSLCKKQFYCSPQCQSQHWQQHQLVCEK